MIYSALSDDNLAQDLNRVMETEGLSREAVYFIRSPGLPVPLQALADRCAQEEGFQAVTWMDTGCVITSHGGPGCFGIVGRSLG